MKLITAKDSDSDRLKAFFERMILPGAIDVSVRRPGSFFDQYHLLSNDFETLMLVDDADQIHGIATLIFREGMVLGEKQTWAFATDLRIAPTRKAIAQWAQFFLPILERIGYERNCRYVFSAVEHHENQAYNALVRPTSHARRRLPRYLLANRFHVICLHGRVPFGSKPLASIRLKEVAASDLEPLCIYLNAQAHLKPLTTHFSPETLLHEIARWPGLTLADFRIACDNRGTIRGVSALYDGRSVQQIVPTAYNGFAHTLHQTLQAASFTRLVRPTPSVNTIFPARFMTHLACDSGEIFHRLVDDAYSRLKPNELLTYLHFRGNWRTLPPASFIASSVPFGLYLILHPHAEAPPWAMRSIRTRPPDFEAAWL